MKTEEYLSQATLNVAAGLELNWGENWDAKMRAEIIGHLVKVAKFLRLHEVHTSSAVVGGADSQKHDKVDRLEQALT